MADKPNINKLFKLETDVPPPCYVPPVNGGVDDISIRGIPHTYALTSLHTLVRMEFAERREYMPHVLYAPIATPDGTQSLRIFFRQPIDNDLALEIFSDCADAIATHLGLPIDNIVLRASKSGLYDYVRDQLMQRRDDCGPDGMDGPA